MAGLADVLMECGLLAVAASEEVGPERAAKLKSPRLARTQVGRKLGGRWLRRSN